MFICHVFMCFCSRTVRSSAGTLVDAWRWKCPKMPTLAFAWWSKDVLVRSGWYETGLSIPDTEARDQPLRRSGQCFRSQLDLKYRTREDWWCVVFHTIDFAAHWASLRPQSFPTLSLKEEYDQSECFTEPHIRRDPTAGCAVWNGPHFWHSATCIEHVKTSHLSAAPEGGSRP